MTTQELLDEQKELSAEVDFYQAILNSYDELRNTMGLIPDSIRNTPDYKSAKSGFNKSFQALRTFNGIHRKELNRLSWSQRLLY